MSDVLFNDGARLDCIVGGVASDAPPVDDKGDQIHVTIRGDGVSASAALALAQDLKYLVQAFRGDASALGQDVVQHFSDLRSRGERTVEIALHDLRLEPDA